MDPRIYPIVGNVIRDRRIAAVGTRCAWAVDLLVSCGAVRWSPGDARPDAIVADAAAVAPGEVARVGRAMGCPAVVLAWPRAGWAMGHAWLCRPGESAIPLVAAPHAAECTHHPVLWTPDHGLRTSDLGLPDSPTPGLPDSRTPRLPDSRPRTPDFGLRTPHPIPDLEVLELNALAADLLRAWFARGTAYAPPGWDERIIAGQTVVSLGAPGWPWQVAWDTPKAFAARDARASAAPPWQAAPPARIPHVLAIALGGVGSWAVHALQGYTERFTLVDPDRVETVNLARQWYRREQVGRAKAHALAENVVAGGGVARGIPAALDEVALERLVERDRPTVAVIATATDDDFALARVLRRHGIPHVVGRCYPRARYFETMLVDGARGPCLGCMRGHLYAGPVPPPTPEDLAAYGRPAPGAPATQPATRLEVGRAALVLARAALALAAPARPAWLEALLDAGRTCLLGANVVIGGAYGLRAPLQVAAYGLPDIVGTQAHERCPDCGRENTVRHRV